MHCCCESSTTRQSRSQETSKSARSFIASFYLLNVTYINRIMLLCIIFTRSFEFKYLEVMIPLVFWGKYRGEVIGESLIFFFVLTKKYSVLFKNEVLTRKICFRKEKKVKCDNYYSRSHLVMLLNEAGISIRIIYNEQSNNIQ